MIQIFTLFFSDESSQAPVLAL